MQIFNNAINSIQKKFDDVIKNKREILHFKKLIEDIYETKDSNFQIIENMNNKLKRLAENDVEYYHKSKNKR